MISYLLTSLLLIVAFWVVLIALFGPFGWVLIIVVGVVVIVLVAGSGAKETPQIGGYSEPQFVM